MSEGYISGVCNIDQEGIRRRYRVGFIGLGSMIVFMVAAEMFHLSPAWKLLIFIPAVYALSGFLQASQRFCFLFGFYGVFQFSGKRSRVKNDAQKQKDMLKAIFLIGQVLLSSMLITLLYYYFS